MIHKLSNITLNYFVSPYTLRLPYDNKLSTEVGSQIHRHPDWLSYLDQALVIVNQDMGVQTELAHILTVQTGFFFFTPAYLSFHLCLLQCHSLDVEELPLGWSHPVYASV